MWSILAAQYSKLAGREKADKNGDGTTDQFWREYGRLLKEDGT